MSGFDAKVRRAVEARTFGICELCGVDRVEQLHHRRPRGMGSSKLPDTNTAANCLGVSMACHAFIEKHREMALDRGWLVRQGFAPATVPVQIHGRSWALFDEQGGVTWPDTGDGRCDRCGCVVERQPHQGGCQLADGRSA